MAPPTSVPLKAPRDWTLIGTRRKRLDVAGKVTGKPIYAIDVRLPGMLYAALAQCPVFGGKLVAADETKIMGHRGVRRVVKFEGAVAVVAESWWQARPHPRALPIVWDMGANANV